MKPTLTLLLAVLAISLFFSSCAKEVTIVPQEYYMKLKINGDWVTLKKTAWKMPISGDPKSTGSHLTAYDDSLGMFFSIALGNPGDEIMPGSYTNSKNNLSASMKIEKMGRYLEYDTNPESAGKTPDFTVQIESVEEYYVHGSFRGNFLVDHKHQQTLEVTEGEFIVQRK